MDENEEKREIIPKFRSKLGVPDDIEDLEQRVGLLEDTITILLEAEKPILKGSRLTIFSEHKWKEAKKNHFALCDLIDMVGLLPEYRQRRPANEEFKSHWRTLLRSSRTTHLLDAIDEMECLDESLKKSVFLFTDYLNDLYQELSKRNVFTHLKVSVKEADSRIDESRETVRKAVD